MVGASEAVERLARLQSILETLVEFEEAFQFDEAWERIIRDAVHLMWATRGTLFLVDRDRNRLIPRVWYGQPWHGQGRPRGYARGEGIAGRVWMTGEPINSPDVRADSRFRRSNDPRWNEIRSLLCVPIRVRERVIGVIAVDSTRENAFQEEDERLLTTLARHVANAFERAKLYQGLSDLRAIGERLNKMGPRAEYRQTLQSIVEKAVRVVAAGASSAGEAAAVIYGYDPERGTFDRASRVAAGWHEDVHIDDYPRPGGLGERAVQQRRRVLSYEETDVELHPAQQAQGAAAVAVYPLIAADEVLGVLYITLRDERRFSRQELMLLDNFVNQAALALYHTRQIQDACRVLARKVYELEQLRRADALISQRPRLKEALAELLHIALEITGAKYGSFRLYNRETNQLELVAAAGVTPSSAVQQPLPLDESSVMGQAVLQRRPIRIDDVQASPWAGVYRPLLTDPPMQSELVVPLFSAGGGLEGVLNIESPEPAAFSEEDERLVVALATQAVIAIQEIKLLDTMAELTEATLTHSREELFELIIRRACELINAPLGAIWRLIEENRQPVLVLQAASGGHRRGDRLPLESSLTGQAVLTRAPVTANDVQNEPAFYYVDLARQQGWRSALIVPLLARDGEPVGAFSLYTTEPRTFSDWDKRLLSVLANHAAIAIRDAEILESLREARERQAVAEAFAAVGDIAANLLHRLNNQIGTIPVRVQGIEAKCAAELQNEYLAKNLAAIAESARQAMQTVRETLRHLRPVETTSVRVGEAILDALREIHIPPEIILRVEQVDTLPPVRASQSQLSLVFVNLLENAIEAMGGEGSIVIRGRPDGDYVLIEVKDTGPGIPPEWQTRVFDLHFSGTNEDRKLGFGLWWVRTLLHRFGGNISLESRVGEGTCFLIRLPIWEEEDDLASTDRGR